MKWIKQTYRSTFLEHGEYLSPSSAVTGELTEQDRKSADEVYGNFRKKKGNSHNRPLRPLSNSYFVTVGGAVGGASRWTGNVGQEIESIGDAAASKATGNLQPRYIRSCVFMTL